MNTFPVTCLFLVVEDAGIEQGVRTSDPVIGGRRSLSGVRIVPSCLVQMTGFVVDPSCGGHHLGRRTGEYPTSVIAVAAAIQQLLDVACLSGRQIAQPVTTDDQVKFVELADTALYLRDICGTNPACPRCRYLGICTLHRTGTDSSSRPNSPGS